jgi:nucleoside-diphosphate-sugar epimerase
MPTPPLVLFGCGYTLTRLALRSRPARRVLAVTSNAERARGLVARGVEVVGEQEALAASGGAHVVVSVPPEAGRDVALAQALAQHPAERLVYLSSTGVYGAASGEVDEETPTAPSHPAAAGRLAAEALFRPLGAVCLRIAGIYGPFRGLHLRLERGEHRLPEGGVRRISRIHVEDLVSAISTALGRAAPGSLLCVADDAPVPQREVVQWLCERLGLPLPPSVPLEQVSPTLRGDRAVQNARLKALGWRPRYPSYREGFAAVLEEEAAGAG